MSRGSKDAGEILAGQAGGRPRQSRRTTAQAEGEAARDEVLARLSRAGQERETIRQREQEKNAEIRRLIVAARDAGATVAPIAMALGISRAAVYAFMREDGQR